MVVAEGAGCCGALNHHLGQREGRGSRPGKNVAWSSRDRGGGLDAIVINASGCGTTVKDYGFMFRATRLEGQRRKVAALARDVSELLGEIGSRAPARRRVGVAYHSACSLQHGQKVRASRGSC